MTGSRVVVGTAAALILVALAAPGCSNLKLPALSLPAQLKLGAKSTVATPTPSTEASGSITTPQSGSAERTALMDAARSTLSTASQFYIFQIYEQGNRAIGDIQAVSSGQRFFVAWTKGPTEWKAVWSTPFGSEDATPARAAAALTGFSADLLDKIAWSVKSPILSTEVVKQGLALEAQKWAKSGAGGKGEPYKVTLLKVAPDALGNWWGHMVVQPAGGASVNFWCRLDNRAGVWSVDPQPANPPAPSTYFPNSVIDHLSLP